MLKKAQTAKSSLFQRLAGLCGILGSILPLTLVLLATVFSAWFSWNKDALSELGVGEQAVIFNSAMLIGGFLNFLFALGLYKYLGSTRLVRAGAVSIMLSSVSLALVGVFSIEIHVPHGLAAFGYFILSPSGFLLIGSGTEEDLIRKLSSAFGVTALLAILVLPVVVLVLSLSVGFAVPELVEGLIISGWTIYMSTRLIRCF
jgi:hypothetical membrane protein